MNTLNAQPLQSSHARWRAVTQRDPSAHCSFLYGVTSTRIYCRPTCTARIARRANVVFYDTSNQARRDGYRPCLKCRPDDQHFMGEREEIVVKALSLLRERSDSTSMHGGLTQLAKDVGVTPSYLCRIFKKTMGMTLGKYIADFEGRSSGSELSGSTLPRECTDVTAVSDGALQLATPTKTLTSTSDCDDLTHSGVDNNCENALCTPLANRDDPFELNLISWYGNAGTVSQLDQVGPTCSLALPSALSHCTAGTKVDFNDSIIEPFGYSGPLDGVTPHSDEWRTA